MSETAPSFVANLERRVKNLALGPRNPANALVPIFEAIYNSIHACQDRFGDDWIAQSRIDVSLINWGQSNPSVEIKDNGIGLNAANFVSFQTYDSDHKLGRGGKGVGRLAWLKVFEAAHIVSRFVEQKSLRQRSFELRLSNEHPFQNYNLAATEQEVGTVVSLRNMRTEYAHRAPQKADVVIKKITAHFATYLIGDEAPLITVEANGTIIDLREVLSDKKLAISTSNVEVPDVGTFAIAHYLLQKGILEPGALHQIMLTANGRVVSERSIGQALGLKTLIERDDNKYTYVGLVSSEALDTSVNSERTAFDIAPEVLEEIEREAMRTVGIAISPQIDRVKKQQTELTRNVVKKYPRYAYLVKNAEDFVEKKIPRNFNRAEQIYQHLALYDFRANRDLERDLESLVKEEDAAHAEETIQQGVDKLLERVNEQEFSILADYTVRRRVILDLLEKQLGYLPDGTLKRSSEEAVHNFIVPIRATSHDVDILNHNLWIIDDKLTYYEFWASDKRIKSVIKDSQSMVRPDVLLFSGQTAFHRPGTDQPIVIVEFKKPARNTYDEEENPIVQVFEYIEELRGGSAVDKDGVLIQEVSDKTPFFCYVVADITSKLQKYLRLTKMNQPIPGGGGYYGFNEDYNAFVQVFSFKHIVKDARLRNEAFFKRLGI